MSSPFLSSLDGCVFVLFGVHGRGRPSPCVCDKTPLSVLCTLCSLHSFLRFIIVGHHSERCFHARAALRTSVSLLWRKSCGAYRRRAVMPFFFVTINCRSRRATRAWAVNTFCSQDHRRATRRLLHFDYVPKKEIWRLLQDSFFQLSTSVSRFVVFVAIFSCFDSWIKSYYGTVNYMRFRAPPLKSEKWALWQRQLLTLKVYKLF